MVVWNTMESSIRGMIQPPTSYLNQLMSNHHAEQTSLVLKSEDSNNSTNSVVPYLNGDCSIYGQEQSPHYNQVYPFDYSNGCSININTNLVNTLQTLSSCGTNTYARKTEQSLSSREAISCEPNLYLEMQNYSRIIQTNIDHLPDTTNFPGEFEFQLSLGPHTESAAKSADYTFSSILKKLYVQRASQCPFMFKTEKKPPSNSYVKILPVFKGTHVLSEPVRRCSNHAEVDDEGGPRYHFIRASNLQSCYNHSDDGRLFVTVPYNGPQVGAEYQIELLSFMCFNSCGHSSHSKRRIDVIFILECEGYVLGRQVIEVRVCACPGRDRTNEEFGSPNYILTKSCKSRRNSEKKRKSSSNDNNQDYTITTSNPVFYQILRQILVTLETQLPQAELVLESSTSPISSVSSPDNVS
ncbi:cellular tumor antigen p53 isoform X3 [Hydra vulgaris]|uniref:Cellular tumor antigen p53 isoform X3 n=2 Tax=Hydra vulgaris TaxID=6087 RepID=A0ABM4C833_HYDVU